MMISTDQAAELIKRGRLVAFPTETVYGLGGNAFDDKAVASIFATKNRPDFNPLIIHFVDAASVAEQVVWNEYAEKLSRAYWPGPLSFVLKRKHNCKISLLASAGLDTLAVRVPKNPIAQALLKACGVPLAAPSANRSGRVSPTEAGHVKEEFGNDFPVLDGGRCTVGLESTVVDLAGEEPVLLRPGSVTREQLEATLGCTVLIAGTGNDIKSPGMLTSHYAPDLPVRLNVKKIEAGEALLAFGNTPLKGAVQTLNLSPTGDLIEAASNLFAYLRALDSRESHGIAVMPIPETGVGLAINDRLRRAAAGR